MSQESLKYVLQQIRRVKKGYIRSLDFYKQKLTSLPKELFELETLEELNLKANLLTEIPRDIEKLKSLTTLIIDGNSLSSLPKEVFRLRNLRHLSVKHNKLKTLPEDIGLLEEIRNINFKDNSLRSLPKALKDLYKMESLDLSCNILAKLDEGLESLVNLETLFLYGNKFKEIPTVVYKLKKLKEFHFNTPKDSFFGNSKTHDNFADEISENICQLEKLKIFNVDAGNFIYPPPEVVSRGVQDIKKFFLQIEAEGQDCLFEAKLLIVGEPGAGKTTLSRKFIDIENELPDDSETTKGIAISKFDFTTANNNTFNVNVWDFGGQEIYNSTHQFFLTKRSLYLLVCDTRQEDTAYNYWLQVIELLSDSSPVIIIHNEKHDRSREINFNALQKRFSNLKDQIYRSNFATKRGLYEIVNVAKDEIQHLNHVGDKLPKTWIRVRRAIESLATHKDYIPDSEYYAICEFNGIGDFDKARQLSNYLHDLGVFLHFKDGSILERIIILNNTWATDAVYKVLDNTVIKDELKGRFEFEDLGKVWNCAGYETKKEELLALMMKFELCYKVDNSSLYIVPQLLPVNEPKFEWDLEKNMRQGLSNLQFRYSYEFMPRGIIEKLMVRLHEYIINQRLFWREGFICERGADRALIKESYGKREIQIFVAGKNQHKIFLSIIIEELDRINSKFPRINYEKYVPCNCELCAKSPKPHFHMYSDITRRIDNNKKTIECPMSYVDVDIKRLMEDVFGDEIDRKLMSKKVDLKRNKTRNRIFISYSHSDVKWLNHLKRHFQPVADKIDFWDDSRISPGEPWKAKIKNAIDDARIAILILSADFLSSSFILNDELPSILESAEYKGTIILAVVLKPCLLDEHPKITQYQFINSPDRSVIEMSEAEQEHTWMKVVREAKKYILES